MKNVICILLGLLFYSMGTAQWADRPSENSQLCDRDLYDFETAVLPDGSFYVVYNGPQNGTLKTSLLYYDKDGKSIWKEERVVSNETFMGWTQVNQLKTIDKDGNIILSVSDTRHRPGHAPSYTAYKINRDGEFLWGEQGIDLSSDFDNLTHSMNIIALENGNCIFAWSEKKSQFGYIRMQCISANGEKLWGTGKRIVSQTEEINYPILIGAGNNEFIALYAKGTSQNLYAQKLDFEGTSVWGEEVLMVDGSTFPTYPIHTVINAIPANGGLIVSWVDLRYGNDNKTVCLAALDTDGKQWFAQKENGLETGTRTGSKAELVYDNEAGQILTTWISEGRVMAQSINKQGKFAWGPEGKEIALSDLQPGYLKMQKAESGRYGIFYMLNEHNNVKIIATLIDDKGLFVWDEESVTISDYACQKSDLAVTEYCQNQWILLWDDERKKENLSDPSEGHRLFAQNIGRNGSLGIQTVATDVVQQQETNNLKVFPNPLAEQNTIRFFQNKPGFVRLDLIDLQGRLTETVFEGHVMAGQTELDYKPERRLQPGLYILQLQTEGLAKSTKIIVK